MSIKLHTLKPTPGSRKKRKRLGRGESSGKGKTSGKGHKGQKSRAGASINPIFEGGQMPLFRRIPKKGFSNSKFKKKVAIVNLSDIEYKYNDGEKVDETSLRKHKLLRGKVDAIKLLGNGDLTKKIEIDLPLISKGAIDKINKNGSKINLSKQKSEKKTTKTSKSKKIKSSKDSKPKSV